MLKPEQVIPFIAEAYHDAALTGINLRAATEALETLRIAMLSESDLLSAWDTIDAQVNRAADVQGLQPLLIRLRDHWKNIILDDECERLKSVFDTNTHTGWIAWLHSFAGALTAFRLDFCKQLCEAPLPFPEAGNPSINQIRLFTDRARHARWAEAFDLYVQLGENEALMSSLRARLLSIAAEIALYHFYQYDRAKMLLEHAQSLASNEWRIIFAWAGYYRQQGEENKEKARECYQRLIDLHPDVSTGYTGLGELLERQNEFAQAEAKYQQAAKCLISPVDGYSALLQLYGQKDLFESRKDNIPILVERINAVALSDGDCYEAMQNAGYAYQLNDKHTEAHCWYQRAIESDPTRLSGYLSEGYLYLDDDNYPGAIEHFQQAINVAPEAMDGYWGMSWVTEEQQDWAATLHWCQESLKRRPQWGGFIHARIGKIKQQQNLVEAAIEEFFAALATDPKNNEAQEGLEQIAAERYQQRNDPEGALQLYQQLREAIGLDYEQTYHNLSGNMHYYLGKYQEASEEYRQAITAAPENPRYYSNLALAIEQFKAPGHRIEELDKAIANARRAFELEPDSSEYTEQLSRLEQERAFVSHYGEQALTFEPQDKPIRVHVQSDALPLILDDERINLSKEFSGMIETLRERIRARHGLTVPGLNFAVLEAPSAYSGDYQIDVMGERVAYGQLEMDKKFAFCSEDQLVEFQLAGIRPYLWSTLDGFSEGYWLVESDWADAISQNIELVDAREYLLRHIEFVVIHSLAELCGHQVTADLLAQCVTDDCIAIKDNPHKLNVLTRMLKDILRRGESIVDLTRICEEVNRLTSGVTNRSDQSQHERPELIPGIKSLTLYLSDTSPLDRAEMDQELVNMQATLFDEVGVIIPLVAIVESNAIDQHDFQLQLNDQKLPITTGLAPGELWVFVPFDNVKDRFPDSRASIEPNSGEPAAVLKATEEVRQEIEMWGYATRDPLGYVIFCTAAELRRRADELLTHDVVEYYLSKLTTDYPALVNVTRYFFSVEELTQRLREQLSMPSLIRNMPAVLEMFLSTVS